VSFLRDWTGGRLADVVLTGKTLCSLHPTRTPLHHHSAPHLRAAAAAAAILSTVVMTFAMSFRWLLSSTSKLAIPRSIARTDFSNSFSAFSPAVA
jgi:hypothetical protein